MGNKRPSVRTLPTGERVVHYPDGHQKLIQDHSPVRDMLDYRSNELDAADAALTEQRIAAVTEKQEALDAGSPVPADKRPI